MCEGYNCGVIGGVKRMTDFYVCSYMCRFRIGKVLCVLFCFYFCFQLFTFLDCFSVAFTSHLFHFLLCLEFGRWNIKSLCELEFFEKGEIDVVSFRSDIVFSPVCGPIPSPLQIVILGYIWISHLDDVSAASGYDSLTGNPNSATSTAGGERDASTHPANEFPDIRNNSDDEVDDEDDDGEARLGQERV